MKQTKILAMLHARSEQAIDTLDKEYGRLCRALAKDLLGSQEDVEEVVSEAFLTVWNTIPPEKPDSLMAYLCRIVRAKAVSAYRRNTAEKRSIRMNVCLSELEEILPGGTEPEAVLQQRMISQTINRFLGSLSKQNRQIFLRRYYRNQSAVQIAKEFGMKESAVRVRLLRMREQLRTELEKEGISV